MTARKDHPRRVPNHPLRATFLASTMTKSEACRLMGWVKADGGVDTSQLTRCLGLQVSVNYKDGKRYESLNSTMAIERAQGLCIVFGVDFDDLHDGLLPVQRARGGRCISCGENLLNSHPTHMCGFCLDELERFGNVDQRVAA